MTDTRLLKTAIDNSGLKINHIAKCMGLSYQGLKNKIDNKSEFIASEIFMLTHILLLTDAERDSIFFANNVASQATEETTK